MNKIGAILLAAGGSSRMGTSKQLLEIHGRTLLERSCDLISSIPCTPKVVVLGAMEGKHLKILATQSDVKVAVNNGWQSGMGGSIKTGLRTVLQSEPDTDAIILLVCDQPHITTTHLQRLMTTYASSACSIVASAYSDTVGVPVLFSKKHFKSLLALTDGEGAKRIIIKCPDSEKKIIDLPEGAIDLDTPADVSNFLKNQRQ